MSINMMAHMLDSFSLKPKVFGSILGFGAVLPSSWGVYQLANVNRVPVQKWKGLSKEEYEKGTFGYSLANSDEATEFLGTGIENKATWINMASSIQEDWTFQYKMQRRGDLTSVWEKVKTPFDENKGENSLNGQCERIYKAKNSNLHNWAAYYFCQPVAWELDY